ncbi:MAG: ribosomal RNA small subunit methyltransferase A [Gemmatimonadota bacterium]|nr:MAG: ribosomal RNA small subunit methyltransferase A [Gemmatimonadota bacterium]
MGRRLGQHFLTDPTILDRIVEAIAPQSDDVVIEIGPGKGSMTRRLVPRVGRVIAIERDSELAAELDARGKGSGEKGKGGDLTVIRGDALDTDWHRLLTDVAHRESQASNQRSPYPFSLFPFPFKVVGNIPYYITSPLIDKALTPPRPQVIVYLIQREVADRLVALPGGKTYGALSVGVQAVAGVERLFVVRAGSFSPPPKVDSAVVRIEPLRDPLVADTEVADFRRFTTGLFSQRRKQLKRVLRSTTGFDATEVDGALSELDLDPTARPEDLGPGDVVLLYRKLGRSNTP